jgi:transcriptional regulator with XRE-family HTH domain
LPLDTVRSLAVQSARDQIGIAAKTMTDEEYHEESIERDEGVGQRLQLARKNASLSLTDVAKETRIPERHLVAIENGEFNRLPAPTYAVGFSRSYARFLGINEHEIVDRVRAELAMTQPTRPDRPDRFEPGDPARVPSRKLAWFGLFAILLLLAGMFAFYRSYFAPGVGPAPLTQQRQIAVNEAAGGDLTLQRPAQATTPSAGGQVVLTALEDGVWARFYDASGTRLLEKQLANGERFVVPRDRQGVQIWTGRPDAFAITIDGRPVPKLAEQQQIIRDVPITAEALLARQGGGTAAAGLSVTTPATAAPAAARP